MKYVTINSELLTDSRLTAIARLVGIILQGLAATKLPVTSKGIADILGFIPDEIEDSFCELEKFGYLIVNNQNDKIIKWKYISNPKDKHYS